MDKKLIQGCSDCPAIRWVHADYVTCALRPRRVRESASDFSLDERDKIREARRTVNPHPGYRPDWCPLPVALVPAPKAVEDPATQRLAVYIAGPYGASEGRTVEENTRRAVVLCRYAQLRGFAPVCVHPLILAGGLGRDDIPEERAAGLATALRLVDVVKGSGPSRLWAITLDSGGLSQGTAMEVTHYGVGMVAMSWAGWLEEFALAGFDPENGAALPPG